MKNTLACKKATDDKLWNMVSTQMSVPETKNIDRESIRVEISKEISIQVSKQLGCIGGHCFIPLEDGTNDVICFRCGIKAKRAQEYLD